MEGAAKCAGPFRRFPMQVHGVHHSRKVYRRVLGGDMFFTRIGMIAAWLVFLGGIARLTMGLVVAFRLYPAQYDASRYIGSATPGRSSIRGYW